VLTPVRDSSVPVEGLGESRTKAVAMADLTAQRTLVKSPPELWSELSEIESLARHLGELGEIRITKVEPETTVAWEGEQISGTVELEQSGWGTKVTFHATVPEPDPAVEDSAAEQAPTAAPEPIAHAPTVARQPTTSGRPPAALPEPALIAPAPTPEPGPATGPEESVEPKRQGFLARWLFRQRQPIESMPVVAEHEPAVTEPGSAVAAVAELEPVTVEMDAVAFAAEREPELSEADRAPAREQETDAPAPIDVERVREVLDGTLDALGQAHHRPFSRG